MFSRNTTPALRKRKKQPSLLPEPEAGNRPSIYHRHLSTAERVALLILGRIMTGQYAPGERLPPQAQLRVDLVPHLSMTDFNKGLKILKKEKFLRIKPYSHTTVADPLPCRNRFAVVFRTERSSSADTSLFSVMESMAGRVRERHGDFECNAFYEYPAEPGNGRSLDDLKEAVRWHRVAGIIFTHQFLENNNLFTEPGIARVFNAEGSATRQPYMLTAPHFKLPEPDGPQFLNRALERLRESGCRTVAVLDPSTGEPPLASPRLDSPLAKHLVDSLTKYEMETRPEWVLRIKAAGWEIGRLLMNLKERPDAIIIDDDSLTPAVTAGIASMPKPWPMVAGVVNFPKLPEAHVPTIFGGFDIEALFEWCFSALLSPEMQAERAHYTVDTLFEDEWRSKGCRPS